MVLAPHPLSCSASDLTALEDCAARVFHTAQRYRAGLLPTDMTAAAFSSALHDAFMQFHRQMEQAYLAGSLPSADQARARLRTLVEIQLRRKRLDRTQAAIIARLERAAAGIARTADLIVADMPTWGTDPGRGDLLVWAEAPLDHGPELAAVELAEGYLVRTRPDVIGLRMVGPDRFRAVVRDYKAKGTAVDPAFDTGILVRAIWVLTEIERPRCRWFLAGREVTVDPTGVELETVNVLFADGAEYLIRASLTSEQVLGQRDRLMAAMGELDVVKTATSAAEVPASPGSLCQSYCPFLARCAPGQAHVRKYAGEAVLGARLAQA